MICSQSQIVPCNSFQSLIVDGKKDFLENSLLHFGIGSWLVMCPLVVCE